MRKTMETLADIYSLSVHDAARTLLGNHAEGRWTEEDMVTMLLRLYSNLPAHEYSESYLSAQDREFDAVVTKLDKGA